jgi:hypothetical protein
MNDLYISSEDWGRIPERMRDGILNYIERRWPPGGFLQAVICNDLREAAGRADDENQLLLFEYVKFFYNHAPHECWGSPEKFQAWLAKNGECGG